MKPKVYLETTIPSYLTARPSRDLLRAACQEATREWWDNCRTDFDLFVSQLVFQEAGDGDPEAAQRRISIIAEISQLDVTTEVAILGDRLVAELILPTKAKTDALHISIAAVNGMDYLLTWNCTHIANAELRHGIERICTEMGYEPPIICTPLELLGKGQANA
jgi:hypothetical protein